MSELRINHPTGDEPGPEVERWTTEELREQFDVLGFMAPFVVVRRKADGRRGSMEFVQNPGRERLYFGFVPEEGR